MKETRRRPRADKAMEEGRRRIDGIDDELLRLLNDRARCALDIGHAKKALGLPVYSAEREAEILARLSGRNQGPLEEPAIRRLFERIIDESRRLERLAVQEPEPGPGGREE
jgi:chorismate mutase